MQARGGHTPQLPTERDVPRPIRAIALPVVILTAAASAAFVLPGRAPAQGPAEHLSTAAALAGGEMVYRDLFCDQAPGLYVFFRLMVLAFGASGSALWFSDAVAVSLSSMLVFLITRRFCQSTLAALLAGVAYPLLYYGASRDIAAQPAGWAVAFFLAALYLLATEGGMADWARSLAAGFLSAAAIVISPGTAIPAIIILAVVRRLTGRAAAWFALGAAFALVPLGAWLIVADALPNLREQLLESSIVSWRYRFALAFGAERGQLQQALLVRWLWERLSFALPGVLPLMAGLGAYTWRRHGEASGILGMWFLLALLELLLRPAMPASGWAPVLAIWAITGAAGFELMLRRSAWRLWPFLARALIIAGLAVGIAHVRNAGRPSAADRTLAGPLTQLAAQVRSATGPADTVLVWDRAPHLYYLIGRPVAGGVVSLDYFSSAAAAKDDSKFFRSRFEKRPAKVILARRRRVGEGTMRQDGLWPVVPPRLGLVEAELAASYTLAAKVSGYEVYVRSERAGAGAEPR